MRICVASLLVSLMLVACSSGSDQSKTAETVAPPVHKIAEDQRAVLDQAKEVSGTMEQSADETKRQVDEQTQ